MKYEQHEISDRRIVKLSKNNSTRDQQEKCQVRTTKMQCEQFEQILMQQDEGALTNTALSHMESCEACRFLSADFGAIHEMALELGAEGIAPPERVWVSLRNQLEGEGL